MPPDEYLTIARPIELETKVLSSRFLSLALPIQGRADVDECLAARRKKLHDATHHCYAYRLGIDGNDYRANDDGEPNGSAGKPILAAIEKFGLTNVLVVVTRYFGGKKLGVGGLVRAYNGAAESLLVSSERITKLVLAPIHAAFPHAFVGQVMHVIEGVGAKINDTRYDEEVHLEIHVRRTLAEMLKEKLVSATSGNVRLRG